MDSLVASEHTIGGRIEDKILVTSNELRDELNLNTDKDFLKNTKVFRLFPENRTRIVKVAADDSLATAFQTLVKHNILSVPVYDEDKQMAIGFIDMLDIVCCVLERVNSQKQGKDVDLQALFSMQDKKCKDVAGVSGRNIFYPIEENCSLWMAMELMVEKKVHRLPVVDSNGSLLTVVTQSHVVDLLYKNIEKFSISGSTVSQLKIGFKDVMSVTVEDTVLDAFRLIYDRRVSGVAVVDKELNLLGNISASDIRFVGYGSQSMSRLFWSVGDFLNMKENERTRSLDHPIAGPICALPSTTFEEVVTKIAITHAHRVYLVNENSSHPIGVISLVDILDAVLKNLSTQQPQLQQHHIKKIPETSIKANIHPNQ